MPTMKTIPLAPPAPEGQVQPPRQKSIVPAFQWAWLSPRISPQRPFRRGRIESKSDDEDGRFSPQRPRRASFDHTSPAARGGVHLNMERGGESYFKHMNDVSMAKSNSIDSEDMSLLTLSKSNDAIVDVTATRARGAYQPHSSMPQKGSRTTLTALLFHLNTILPEYCHHFSSISEDTLKSTAGASKAVNALERGAKNLSVEFGVGANSMGPQSSPPTPKNERMRSAFLLSKQSTTSIGESSAVNASSAPSSPSYPGTPPKWNLTSQASSPSSSPMKLKDVRHWLSPLSPRSRDSREKSARPKISPKKRSAISETSKWNSAIAEWERFVSPFSMLVGAECLYGGMQHVLDPKLSMDESAKESANSKKVESKRSLFVKFAMNPGRISQEVLGGEQGASSASPGSASSSLFHQGGDDSPSVASLSEAHKRGSRRLITMYRQIREDLIIVGEYLCDPVLGARAAPGSSKKGLAKPARLPPPPMNLSADTPSSSRAPSPEKSAGRVYSAGDESKRPENDNRYTTHERREFAAISLRNTLDALISFIDARCVLVRIHADLCCPSSPLLAAADGACIQQNKLSPGGRDIKWIALADQCQCVLEPVSAWAKEEGCMTKKAVSGIERETKAMELALTSIRYLYECNLFKCVLNVRRLHVLLRKISYRATSLPIMYIQSSFPELLAMMQIYFADAGTCLEMLRNLHSSSMSRSIQSGSSSDGKTSFNKVDDASMKSPSEATSFNPLFAEFIEKNSHGTPLAATVVRRAGDKIYSSSEEKQNEGNDDEESLESIPSWKPLYINSTLNNDIAGTATSNILRDNYDSIFTGIIKKNFSTGRESDAKASGANASSTNRAKSGRETSWPFEEWTQIETVLTKHCTTEATNSAKYSIESVYARAAVSKNTINDKTIRRSPSLNRSRVISHCHISSITDSICLLVIQKEGPAKKHKASGDEIQQFMQMMVSKICPENLLNIKVVMRLKSELSHAEDSMSEYSKISRSNNNNNNNIPATTSLWSDSVWSDAQRKKILHSLGLRRKHSPVMAPLKSPYVRRSGKRQKKKKIQNSINLGHLDFFLGTELSLLLVAREEENEEFNQPWTSYLFPWT